MTGKKSKKSAPPKQWDGKLTAKDREEYDALLTDVINLDHSGFFGHNKIWDFEDASATEQLVQAKYDFENGDLMAVSRAVEICDRANRSIPKWAVPELARQARLQLGIPRKDDKLYRKTKTASLNRSRQLAMYAAVEAAKLEFSEDTQVEHLRVARLCLAADAINVEPDSLKTIYNRVRRSKPRQPRKKIAGFRYLLKELISEGKI